eukprot:gene28507-34415_t
MAALLPQDHADFTTKEYWDKFFQERNKEAFEWYGNFSDVLPPLLPNIKKTDRLLVIGCGNSNFSSQLYDLGFHNIINLDFSEVVITEMREKNGERPLMQWQVGDMTDLSAYANQSFDAVLDKGALDALFSANSPALRHQAEKMFAEIARVLSEQGKYICITLAESYIYNTLMNFFNPPSPPYFAIHIRGIYPSTPSPFLPLMFVIHQAASSPSLTNTVYVSAFGERLRTPLVLSHAHTHEHISSIQHYIRRTYALRTLQVGRFDVLHIHSSNKTAHTSIPRFTLYVVDVTENAVRNAAVFLVPQGRESEFMFSSQRGLTDIAYNAQCRRLIAVCCNRPHHFPSSSAELQAELSPLLLPLFPHPHPASEEVPYMALGNEDEGWQMLEEGHGDKGYVVEEREDEEDSKAVFRRLLFLENQQLVQTEVRLKSAAAKNKKKGAKKAAGAGAGDAEWVFDYSYLDPHHRGMLAGFTVAPHLIARSSSKEQQLRGAVLGLGGGALVMALQRLLPAQLDCVEIDPRLPALAEKHFGFVPRKSATTVLVMDAQDYLVSGSAAVPPLDFVILDLDSKDVELGMTAPPAVFLTAPVLAGLYGRLAEGGVALINVAARDPQLLRSALSSLRQQFQCDTSLSEREDSDGVAESVYVLQPSLENVNITVICLKTQTPARRAETVGGGNAGKKTIVSPRPTVQYRMALQAWMKEFNGADFLNLEELVDKIQPLSAFLKYTQEG